MKRLVIEKLNIPLYKENEVTSQKLFKDRKPRDKEGNLLFHEEGIFSKKIFGKFDKCTCGKKNIGYCKECETRVISRKNIPTFFIRFNHLDIPNYVIKANADVIKLFEYQAFLYKGEIIDFQLKEDMLSQYDSKEIKIGKDAILELGYTEEFYEKHTSNAIVIPHTSMRPILKSPKGEYVLGELNSLFIYLLRKKNQLEKYFELEERSVFLELALKRKLIQYIQAIRQELVTILTSGKKSVVAKELRGQKVVGSMRAVVINNFQLKEDTILIGKYFIPHLYPILSKNYLKENGEYDIRGLNVALKDKLTLVNRQPSISALSMLAFIPQFSDKDIEKFVVQLNPIVFDGMGMDVDGDQAFVVPLYSKKAIEEARKLLTTYNYMEVSNNTIRQALPEDFVYARGRLENGIN